jgi:hypothetical protein
VKRAFTLEGEPWVVSVILGPFVKIQSSYLISSHLSRLNDFESNHFFLHNMSNFSINHTALIVVTKLFVGGI